MSEIRRLNGEEDNFFSEYYRNPLTLISYLLSLSIGLYILIMEFEKLGEQKSQTIDFFGNMEYQYHYSDALPLHAANWFYVDRVFKRIQEHQDKNRLETDPKKKFREYKNIPDTWSEMDWFDKRFIEEFLCNRSSV